MYKCSKLNCWNILTKEKKHSQQTIFYFRMNLYFQYTCFIGQHEPAFYDKMFWKYMHSNTGFPSWEEAYFNIECTNIATRWACLDIPSQWFTSQSVICKYCRCWSKKKLPYRPLHTMWKLSFINVDQTKMDSQFQVTYAVTIQAWIP